jgi:putative ABC transport system substrate-binding protein
LLSLEVQDAAALDKAFKGAVDARAGALLVLTSALFLPHAERIAGLAVKSRLPAIYQFRLYVEAGGLMSYTGDLMEIFRRAAVFVDKLLRGTKPAELPVEQPTKFELLINLRAARSIGLTVPARLLSRADEVIQ